MPDPSGLCTRSVCWVYARGRRTDCVCDCWVLERGRHVDVRYLVYEHAAVHAGDLAAAHVGHLEVGVQQQLAAERQLLGGIVNTYVEVQLLLAENQPVCQTESVGAHSTQL